MDNSIKDLPNFCKFENSDFTRFMIVSKTAQENVTTNCSITRRICLKK